MNSSSEKLELLRSGRDLNASEAAVVFESLLQSDDPEFLAAILETWAKKGAAASEISTCAGILRANAFCVDHKSSGVLDIVGTGGSRSKLFNISTAAAFVAAGAGVPVAKHGNRSASSKTGSADVLSVLGVDIASEPSLAAGILKDAGICFMFAPKFHRLSPVLAYVRKSLGVPTIFNLLGPLANPARAEFQRTGVWDRKYLRPMAEAVAELGTKKTWIVHAESGLDEIDLGGVTSVAEINGSTIKYFEVSPSDFGVELALIDPVPDLTAEKSAQIILSILNGGNPDGKETAIVTLNAAAAIYIYGKGETLKDSAELARKSVETGAAAAKLNELVRGSSS